MRVEFKCKNGKDSLCRFCTLIPTINITYCKRHKTSNSEYSSQLLVDFEWLGFVLTFVLKELKTNHIRTEKEILSNEMNAIKIDCESIRINGNEYVTPFGYYIGKNTKTFI